MHNQHAGLSQLLTTQHLTERQDQATQARLAHSAAQPRRRQRRWWLAPRWWLLARRPGAVTQPAVGHPHHIR